MSFFKRLLKKVIGWPLTIGTSWLPHGAQFTRYFMYEKLGTLIKEPNEGAGKKVLSISHSNILIESVGLGKANVIEANYPEHSAIDLRAFGSGEFDYVVSDMVLEHVEGDPQAVFSETLRLLKPGGIAVHATCFINPIHYGPADFWRFTPDCLKWLAKQFSEVIEVGGFGNRAIFIIDFLGLRYVPVPHAKWHPLHIIATKNEEAWPVSTWVIARK